MTDKRLEQILKHALTPEIGDSEIQIRRKEMNNKMNNKMKKIFKVGLVACAVMAFAIMGIFAAVGQDAKNENLFVITAYAAELPEGAASGDVVSLSAVQAGCGSSEYLDGRFTISGENIEKIKIATDKCYIYTVNSLVTDGASNENYAIAGNTYEGAYTENMYFGMSVPDELQSDKYDLQEAYREDVDQVNGAILTIEVTFSDGTAEVHHYKVNTGEIYVPADENENLQWDNLTRFLTAEESAKETPYVYGYLIEKID